MTGFVFLLSGAMCYLCSARQLLQPFAPPRSSFSRSLTRAVWTHRSFLRSQCGERLPAGPRCEPAEWKFGISVFCSCLIRFSQVLLGYVPELIIVIETHCPRAGGELSVFMNEGGHAPVQSMPLTSRLISCSPASSASASSSSSCGFSHLPPPAHAR